MIESTARAERSPVGSPSRPGYLWEVPQKPVSVYLPFEMIDRLESLVVENFRSLTSRGSEIGGLLVGRPSQGTPLVVLVENFELIACDYSRGPLYRLSEADMGRFERSMEQYGGADGLRAVGFFRSHTRKGLLLDPDDMAFLDARFREPHQFALLVRPSATKGSTGGIFIRENGSIRAEASYLEFPFRSSQLTASSGPPKAETASAVAEPPAAPAAPAVAPPQKPSGRGQIVPIASRREIAVPAPEPPPAVVEPPAPPVVQAPPPAAAPKPPAETAVRVAEKPVEKPAEKPAPRRSEAALPKSFTAVEEAPAEAARGGNKLVWILVALAVIALAAVGYMYYPGFHKTPGVPAAGANTLAMGLHAEHSGPDLLLTWNGESYGAKNGKVGKLQVSDGDTRQNYDIDHAELVKGLGVVYSPLTQDVTFEIVVTNDKGEVVGKDATRFLNARPSPMEDQKAASAAKPAATPAPKNETPAEAASAPAPAAEPQAERPTTPRKAFDSASLRLRPATQVDVSNALPEAPTVGAGTAPQAGSLPGQNLGSAPPPPRASAPPPPTTRATSQLVQPQIVVKREPDYPRFAQQMKLRGVVELTATIGVDGRVKAIKLVKGTPILAKAAQDAVMQWVYKPAMLNGVPIENAIDISITFDPTKQ